MPTDNAVASTTDESVRRLMDAVRAGKRLNDAADTILHYYESLVAMQNDMDARVRSAIDVEARTLLAERAELVSAMQKIIDSYFSGDDEWNVVGNRIEDARELLERIGGGK